MSVIRFDIRYPTGHRDTAVVEGVRALIGSASYADVRLPVDQAAYEHVVIEVVGGTVRATARAFQPPATVNGMPLTASTIDPNTVLGLGNVQIFVSLVAAGAHLGGQAPVKKAKQGSPALQAVGVLMILGMSYFAFFESTDSGPPPPPAAAPVLFTATNTPCKQTGADQALLLARETMDLAEGKRERHPFAPAEGVAAVELYRQAAACFRVAKEEALATEAESSAKQLKAAIITDFRARRLRLEHMLEVKDYELAERDVTALTQITQGKAGPYTAWLSSLAEDLKRRRAVPKE